MRPLALTLLLVFPAFADTDRPQLVSSTPAQGQDSVSPNTQIKLVFSKPMHVSNINTEGSFILLAANSVGWPSRRVSSRVTSAGLFGMTNSPLGGGLILGDAAGLCGLLRRLADFPYGSQLDVFRAGGDPGWQTY